jgi:fengycin family lipopeptide synthetase D
MFRENKNEIAVAANQNIRQRNYWLKRLAGEPGRGRFPCDFPGITGSAEGRGETVPLKIPAACSRQVLDLGAGSDYSLHVILSAALLALIYRYTEQADMVIAAPIYKQEDEAEFINTVLALRQYIGGEATFKELLLRVRQTIQQAVENQDFPVEILYEAPPFEVALLLENIHERRYLEHLELTMLFAFSREEGHIGGVVEYNGRLYKRETVRRLTDHFANLLAGAACDLHRPIAQIDMLTAAERQRCLFDFNDTRTDYPHQKTVYQLFEEQAHKSPAAACLLFEDRWLTSGELHLRAGQLAGNLQERGCCPADIIGILSERSPQMVIALMAVLRLGAAYLPLDPDTPADRVRYMLKDCAARQLVTQQGFADYCRDICGWVDADAAASYRPQEDGAIPAAPAARLAYVTFTSGSTGRPKGVMIEHRSLGNFIKGMTDLIPFTHRDAILSLTTIAFDIFGLETLLPFSRGTRVVIGSREEQLNNDAIALILERQGITIFQVTPSRLHLLLSYGRSAGSLRLVKHLIVGGEAFPESLLTEVRNVSEGKIYNVYGPTETTIWSTVKDVSGTRPLNIGRPIANTQVYIQNKCGAIQPPGLWGELCIAGDGVARGYLNRPELSAEKFERRVYRSGDLARWLADGDIEFSGRLDHQIKLRGYRVELGEIESRLMAHEDIQDAVVVVKEKDRVDKYLVAFMVLSEAEPANRRWREYLSTKLPDHMIPSIFVPLDRLPLTANGKVDRKALAAYEIKSFQEYEYVAPEGELERLVAHAWRDILRADKIGVNQNFFDIGGNSMDLIAVNNKLKEALKVDIPVVAMFRFATVRTFARFLAGQAPAGPIVAEEQLNALDRGKGKIKNLKTRMTENRK